MDWKIWWRKALLGALTAGAVAAIAYTIATVTALSENPNAAAWVAIIAPVVLHLLGLANNWLKHG